MLWVKQIGGLNVDDGVSIKTDLLDNVYITGYFSSTVDFNPNSAIYNLTPITYRDVFVLKLDLNGDFIWAKQIGGNNIAMAKSIALDGNANVYTTGLFYGNVDFDPSSSFYNLISNGGSDAFISKLDVNGNFIWAKQIGGIQQDDIKAIIVDKSSNVYTSGIFTNLVDFNPDLGTYNLFGDSIESRFFLQKMGQLSVGIKETQLSKNLSIYPNPSSSKLYFTTDNLSLSNFNVNIYDMLGKIILYKKYENTTGVIELNLNTQNGMYIMSVLDLETNTQYKQKIIINK